MAKRPVFEAQDTAPYMNRREVEFQFFGGFSIQQKQRCIRSLHQNYEELLRQEGKTGRILEISSKSENPLGVAMSAFNLQMTLNSGQKSSVESIFQGSKVFEHGGPYTDLYGRPSIEAKRDPRIRESGNVVGFRCFSYDFPTEPRTFFYDWLYVNTLHQNTALADQVTEYTAFTDIEFNPAKQINCQAEAAAIYVGLRRSGMLEKALESRDAFREIVFGR